MSFVEQVKKNLEGKLRIDDGNCGTTHKYYENYQGWEEEQ